MIVLKNFNKECIPPKDRKHCFSTHVIIREGENEEKIGRESYVSRREREINRKTDR